MSSTLSDAPCNIGVDLRITLGALEVDTSLLGNPLVAQSLPLRQPALMIRLRTWIFGVEVLWVLDGSLALLGRHEDLGATLGLLDDVLGLFLLSPLGHAVIDQSIDDVFILIFLLELREGKLLLDL